MQRLFIILIVIFILIMTVSAFILNMMKRDMTEVYQVKKETAKSEAPSKKTSKPVGLKKSERPKEIPKERIKIEELSPKKEPEYDFTDISIEEARAIEGEAEEEVLKEGEVPQKRLSTQPPADKLKELKIKGTIIY